MPITWVLLSKSGLRREWLNSRNIPLGYAADDKTVGYVPSWAAALYKAECGGGAVGGDPPNPLPIEWERQLNAGGDNRKHKYQLGSSTRPNKGLSKEEIRELAIQLRRVADPDGALKAALVVLTIAGFQSALTFLRAQE